MGLILALAALAVFEAFIARCYAHNDDKGMAIIAALLSALCAVGTLAVVITAVAS